MAILRRASRDLNVLSPTFRTALAMTLSRQFHLNCYSNIHAREEGERESDDKWKQASVTLNSMVRIPDCLLQSYDVVVIDECVMVMEHILNETMHEARNISHVYL